MKKTQETQTIEFNVEISRNIPQPEVAFIREDSLLLSRNWCRRFSLNFASTLHTHTHLDLYFFFFCRKIGEGEVPFGGRGGARLPISTESTSKILWTKKWEHEQNGQAGNHRRFTGNSRPLLESRQRTINCTERGSRTGNCPSNHRGRSHSSY